MSLNSLITSLGSGAWTDRISKLKTLCQSNPLSGTDRKALQDEIVRLAASGKRGRLCNLVLLAVAADAERWTRWIKRSGILRASRYDFNPSTAKYVVDQLLNAAVQLDLSAPFIQYLTSVESLLQIAPSVQALNTAVVQRLWKDRRHALKGLLISLDLTFMIRSEFGRLEFDELVPEDLAEGFSYLMFLFAKRFGTDRADIGEMDLATVVTDHYFELIKDASRIRTYARWEILLDYFDYTCRFDASDRTGAIAAPNPRFAQALRAGFIHDFNQRIAIEHKLDIEEASSILECGRKLYDIMQKKGLIRLEGNPVERWVFHLPGPDALSKFIDLKPLFKEEAPWLVRLGKDLYVGLDQLQRFEVAGVTLGALVRAQRFINLIRAAIMPFLAGQLKQNAGLVAQSLVPVFRREVLLQLLTFGSDCEQAERLLNLLTWKPNSTTVFDAMYQPLVETRPGWYMVPLNILGAADLVRNTMALTQVRLSDGKTDPLGGLFRNVLSKATEEAASDIGYKYGDDAGDIDAICVIENTLFVFECKNSLHPCSTFELRTSFDHLLGAQDQLDRFLRLWKEAGYRQWLADRLGWDLGAIKNVVTCIVTGNRMFGGLRLGTHAVRPFYEIGNYILSGKVTIFGKEVDVRSQGSLSAEMLTEFIETDKLHEKTFAALYRADDRFALPDGIIVTVENYRLNPVKLASEFGVEAPTEIAEKFSEIEHDEATNPSTPVDR